MRQSLLCNDDLHDDEVSPLVEEGQGEEVLAPHPSKANPPSATFKQVAADHHVMIIMRNEYENEDDPTLASCCQRQTNTAPVSRRVG